MADNEAILTASARYPKPAERTFQYGTAGVSNSNPKLHNHVLSDIDLVQNEGVCLVNPTFPLLEPNVTLLVIAVCY